MSNIPLSPDSKYSADGGHTPVLLDDVLKFLLPFPGKNYIDATGGPGNMSRALLERTGPRGRVMTIDCDPRATEFQEKNLAIFGDNSVRVSGNFRDIQSLAKMYSFSEVDGILFDLGVSSAMLDLADYGISIRHDAPLDMRFDPSLKVNARDLVNNLNENELVEILKAMDEIRFARKIARAIIRSRDESPIETTGRLADIVSKAVPRRFHPKKNHVATKTFLALRVKVNSEREALSEALMSCPDLLAANGVLVVICYSSFEDRIVKETWRGNRERLERLTKKPVTPSDEEIYANPRSRSARLRAFRKIA